MTATGSGHDDDGEPAADATEGARQSGPGHDRGPLSDPALTVSDIQPRE